MKIPVTGGHIHARGLGAGEPLIIMHGGLGWGHGYLSPWLDGLADELRLIYYDHRGSGRSSRIPDAPGFESAMWIDDVERLRRHLGLERILLFGHSYGGALAQEYAARHPDRVAGLILCATAPAFDYVDQVVEAARDRATAEQMDAFLAGLTTPPADDAAVAAMARTVLPLYFHRWRAEFGEALLNGVRHDARAYEQVYFRYLPTFDVVSRLDRIDAPTLILAGADDFICPPAQGERIAARIPGAELLVLEASGHFPFVEERERLVDAVREWIEQC